MRDPYSGDPKLFLSENGLTLQFCDGQPVMDQGFENFVLISLFTAPGYWGNTLKRSGLRYGSEFYRRVMVDKEPITLANLTGWEKSAEKDLQYSPFGEVRVKITNPQSNRLRLVARITPPDGTPQELVLLRNGQNWINQKNQEGVTC